MKKSSNFSDQSNIESRKVKLLIIFMLLALMGPTHAGWFGPNNYDECILENMKGVSANTAVAAIQKSCRAKFPDACVAWSHGLEEWKTKSRRYYKNKPSCDAGQSSKAARQCKKDDSNCIAPSSQEKVRRSLCEIDFTLNSPRPPDMPTGCE